MNWNRSSGVNSVQNLHGEIVFNVPDCYWSEYASIIKDGDENKRTQHATSVCCVMTYYSHLHKHCNWLRNIFIPVLLAIRYRRQFSTEMNDTTPKNSQYIRNSGIAINLYLNSASFVVFNVLADRFANKHWILFSSFRVSSQSRENFRNCCTSFTNCC